MAHRSAFWSGTLAALAAALAFGATAPLVARGASLLGPFTTAACLYVGAIVGALLMRIGRSRGGPRLGAKVLPRLALVAVLGAAVAPACLAWGLPRVGATSGSLLLNLEGVFTVLLARAFYREPLGRRAWIALAMTAAGGVLVGVGSWGDTSLTLAGAAAVACATLGWGLDSALSRPLADFDPLEVVATKALIGAALTTAASRLVREPLPAALPAFEMLATGAIGYGVSLWLYLAAQRTMGAARTASVFAAAPFVGAAVSWVLGDRALATPAWVSLAFFGIGLYLHATERHGHRHFHHAVTHDHLHRHDDGHHDHAHEPPFLGEHSHPHAHAEAEHDHPHGLDLHHDHAH